MLFDDEIVPTTDGCGNFPIHKMHEAKKCANLGSYVPSAAQIRVITMHKKILFKIMLENSLPNTRSNNIHFVYFLKKNCA